MLVDWATGENYFLVHSLYHFAVTSYSGRDNKTAFSDHSYKGIDPVHEGRANHLTKVPPPNNITPGCYAVNIIRWWEHSNLNFPPWPLLRLDHKTFFFFFVTSHLFFIYHWFKIYNGFPTPVLALTPNFSCYNYASPSCPRERSCYYNLSQNVNI